MYQPGKNANSARDQPNRKNDFSLSPFAPENAPRPSEHPPVRGENVKTFRWDHRLQIQNLFMAFKRVRSPMVVTLGIYLFAVHGLSERTTVQTSSIL